MIKVLITDDTQFMRTNLKLIFERNGMAVVGEADNGEKAVQMYEQFKPDIVTMDITMPTMDGIEATRQIMKRDSNAKVIMVSALGQESFVKESILAGAKNFIVKPFKEEKVIEVINKAMSL